MIGQVFLTVLSGVTVFVLGQLFVKFVIDPIQSFYAVVGEVGHSLIYYANVYSNTGLSDQSERQNAQEVFRRLSCELYMRAYAIPGYRLWAHLRFLPPREQVAEAGSLMIGLSNGCIDTTETAADRNENRRGKLEKLLRLETGR